MSEAIDYYRVYSKGEHPKPKKLFHDGTFGKRQQARQWCRNHSRLQDLVIVWPDGTEEKYLPASLH